jgi:hypothetical protein
LTIQTSQFEPFNPASLLRIPLDQKAAYFSEQLGPPDRISSTATLLVFDYEEFARHEHACSLVFDALGQSTLCVTRRFALPQDFSALFPAANTACLESRGPRTQFRKLDEQRALVGIGQYQLVLVRVTALKRFFPWSPID